MKNQRIFIRPFPSQLSAALRIFTVISILFSWTGVSAQALQWDATRKDHIMRTLQNQRTKALLIYQDGKIVFQYGSTHQNYQIFSIRKSLLSLLYGIYAHEGKINLKVTLEELGIDDIQGLTHEEKQAKVIDLLRARSGVYHPAAYETPGMEKNRPMRGQYKPGEKWFYNNWDFNALNTIFEKTTGQNVFSAFEKRIAKRIGMEDFNRAKQHYFLDSMSVHPATLWFMSASDIAKLGLMLLNDGVWNGEEIITPAWIAESTAPYSDIDILGGYGCGWWAALKGNHFPFVTMPDGTYSARGTGEQTLLIIPARKIVLVHLTEVTSPTDPMMKVTEFGRLLKIILE